MDVRPSGVLRVARAESPRVDRAALDRLKALILEGFGTPTGAMIEARPRSLPLEGEADATPGSPSPCPATRSVSPIRFLDTEPGGGIGVRLSEQKKS